MMEFSEEKFEQCVVDIDDIYLDPNNPRFLETDFDDFVVSEDRITEDKVQTETLKKMLSPAFDVSSLRDNILAVGFLPIDKIVVRNINGKNGQYVVIEGNRRIAAIKSLLNLETIGKINLTEPQKKNFRTIDVLRVKNMPGNLHNILIPGIRHISGIKAWGAYQKAVLVNRLKESGIDDDQISNMLGIPKATVKQTKRSFYLFEMAKSSEGLEYIIKPKDYSYFEEAMKSPSIRNWLDIKDTPLECGNLEHFGLLLSWMFGKYNETTGENDPPKLPEAKSMRKFANLLLEENNRFYQVFINTNKTIDEIDFEIKTSRPNTNWKDAIENLRHEFEIMPFVTIQSFQEEDLELIEKMMDFIKEKVTAIKKLRTP